MPMYEYKCNECRVIETIRRSVDLRHYGGRCDCGGRLKRKHSVPHNAPIPGIPNKVNRNWKETGQPADEKWGDILETS